MYCFNLVHTSGQVIMHKMYSKLPSKFSMHIFIYMRLLYLYIYTVSRKRCHWFFCYNFYKYWRLFIFFCAQLRKRMPKSLHKNLSSAHRARDTCTVTMLQRETPEFISPEMWPPNSPDLNPVDYSICGMLQERVCRSWIHDVSSKNVESWRTSAEGVKAAGPCTLSSRQRLRSGVVVWNACVRVNSEHKFWASDFLLCFVCFIDTGFHKCDL